MSETNRTEKSVDPHKELKYGVRGVVIEERIV